MNASSIFHSLSTAEYRQLQAAATNAFRLLTYDTSWADYYAGILVLSAPDSSDFRALQQSALDLCRHLQLETTSVYGRILAKSQSDKSAPALLKGLESKSVELIVLESGLQYKIDPANGYSIGLFIDQNQNRLFLRNLKPARLLNCFAYTCAFSVAGASCGAETTSIDIAKKALDWGKENFALNDIDPARHRFFADDVRKSLPRLARRGERFDCIVLDPPTFARGSGGKSFRVEDELPGLIREALACLAPGGSLLLSTNCRPIRSSDLERMAKEVSAGCKRTVRFHHEPPPPGLPAFAMPSTLWLLDISGG